MVSYSNIILFSVASSVLAVLYFNDIKLRAHALAVQGLLIAVMVVFIDGGDMSVPMLILGILTLGIKGFWVPNLFLSPGIKLLSIRSLALVVGFVLLVRLGIHLPGTRSLLVGFGLAVAGAMVVLGLAMACSGSRQVLGVAGAVLLENGIFLLGVIFPSLLLLVLIPLLGEFFVFSTMLAAADQAD